MNRVFEMTSDSIYIVLITASLVAGTALEAPSLVYFFLKEEIKNWQKRN